MATGQSSMTAARDTDRTAEKGFEVSVWRDSGTLRQLPALLVVAGQKQEEKQFVCVCKLLREQWCQYRV